MYRECRESKCGHVTVNHVEGAGRASISGKRGRSWQGRAPPDGGIERKATYSRAASEEETVRVGGTKVSQPRNTKGFAHRGWGAGICSTWDRKPLEGLTWGRG